MDQKLKNEIMAWHNLHDMHLSDAEEITIVKVVSYYFAHRGGIELHKYDRKITFGPLTVYAPWHLIHLLDAMDQKGFGEFVKNYDYEPSQEAIAAFNQVVKTLDKIDKRFDNKKLPF